MLWSNELNGVFMMPKSVLKYINNAKKSEIKVIMYLFSKGESFDVNEASRELCESVESINSALSFWRGTGVLSECENEKVENAEMLTNQSNAPVGKSDTSNTNVESYSTLDVANATLNDNEFKEIIMFVQSTLGDLPNASKQAQLYYLYDNLGMQSDVIMGIIAHCAAMGKTQMSYIKKTAEGIHNDGVVTYKELEAYFKAKEDYRKYESCVKRVIGAGERAFTASEAKLVKTWEAEWKIPMELVNLAYERTISLISKPSLPYMSKILEGWHNEGIISAEDARRAIDEKAQKNKKSASSDDVESLKKKGFDIELEDIFEKP